MSESDLKAALLLAAPLALPTLRLFVRPIMRVRRDERVYSIGIKGQSDLYGLVRGGGHIELELKDVHTVTTSHQRTWRAFCRTWGVPHRELRARAGESTEQTVERWVEEIRELIPCCEK